MKEPTSPTKPPTTNHGAVFEFENNEVHKIAKADAGFAVITPIVKTRMTDGVSSTKDAMCDR